MVNLSKIISGNVRSSANAPSFDLGYKTRLLVYDLSFFASNSYYVLFYCIPNVSTKQNEVLHCPYLCSGPLAKFGNTRDYTAGFNFISKGKLRDMNPTLDCTKSINPGQNFCVPEKAVSDAELHCQGAKKRRARYAFSNVIALKYINIHRKEDFT